MVRPSDVFIPAVGELFNVNAIVAGDEHSSEQTEALKQGVKGLAHEIGVYPRLMAASRTIRVTFDVHGSRSRASPTLHLQNIVINKLSI